MKHFNLKIVAVGLITLTLAGCASYRTSSSGPPTSTSDTQTAIDATPSNVEIIVTESSMIDRNYEIIGPIEVKVSKLTAFHKDPTEEQANEALINKAREVGADAVIDVTYKSGTGFTTWGYIKANGTGIRYSD